MSARHTFNFDGGEDLTTMGACWFVSYLYYTKIDKNHKNWDRVSTTSSRISVFRRTSYYHKYWLTEILKMDVGNLNKNTLGLSGYDVKRMVEECLKKI